MIWKKFYFLYSAILILNGNPLEKYYIDYADIAGGKFELLMGSTPPLYKGKRKIKSLSDNNQPTIKSK